MTPTFLRTVAALAVLATLLAGCSAGSDPADGPTSSASSPSSADPEPAPSSTLTAEEQQAVEEAAAVVLARQQLVYELMGDPTRSLNELNGFVAQPQLDRDLASLQRLTDQSVAGNLIVDSSGPVEIASVEPIRVDLDEDQGSVSLLVCVDLSSASGTQGGAPWTGRREAAEYRVVRTTYLPAPGWAVAQVLPPQGFDQPQPC